MSSTSVTVGARVVISGGLYGTVRYIGATKDPGRWIGIELDEKKGQGNGSIGGVEYFKCENGYATFVRPNAVTIVKDKRAQATSATGTGLRSATTSSVAGPALRRPVLSATKPTTSTGSSRIPVLRRDSSRSSRSAAAEEDAASTASSTASVDDTDETDTVATAPVNDEELMQEDEAPTDSVVTEVSGADGKAPGQIGNRAEEEVEDQAVVQEEGDEALENSSPKETTLETPAAPAAPAATDDQAVELNVSPAVVTHDAAHAPKTPLIPSNVQEILDRKSKITAQLSAKHVHTPVAELPQRIAVKHEATASASAADEKQLAAWAHKEKEYQQQIDELKKKLDKLSLDNSKSEETIRSLTERLTVAANQSKKAERDLQREKAKFDEKLADMEHQLESATLDKEFAEEQVEVLQQEIDSLKAQVETLAERLKISEFERATLMQQKARADQITGEDDVQALVAQNERLKQALVALRDRTLSEKTEMQKRIRELEKEASRIQQLEAKISDLEANTSRLHDAQEVIEDLKDQLDSARASEDLVEDLTEKNLTLGEEIKSLQETVKELEELNILSEELAQHHAAEERQLRVLLDARDTKIAELEQTVETQKRILEERQTSTNRYRERLQSLEGELHSLRKLHQDKETQSAQLQSKTDEVMSVYHQLQAKVMKTKAMALNNELSSFDTQQTMHQLAFTQEMLPEEVVLGDVKCYKTLLIMDRIRFKADLISRTAKEEIGGRRGKRAEEDISSEEGDRSYGEEVTQRSVADDAEFAFMHQLQFYMALCNFCVARIQGHVTRITDVNQYLNLKTYHRDLMDVEKYLDAMLEDIKKDDLNQNAVMVNLRPLLRRLTQLLSEFGFSNNKTSPPTTWSVMACLAHALVAQVQAVKGGMEAIQAVFKRALLKEGGAGGDVPMEDGLSAFQGEALKLIQQLRQLARLCSQDEQIASRSCANADSYNVVVVCAMFIALLLASVQKSATEILQVAADVSTGLRDNSLAEMRESIRQLFQLEFLHSAPLPSDEEDINLESLVFFNATPALLRAHAIPIDQLKVIHADLLQPQRREDGLLVYLSNLTQGLARICDELDRADGSARGEELSAVPLWQKRCAEIKAELSSIGQLRSQLAEARKALDRTQQLLKDRDYELAQAIERAEVAEKRCKVAQQKVDEYDELMKRVEDAEAMRAKIEELMKNEKAYKDAIDSLESDITDLEQQLKIALQRGAETVPSPSNRGAIAQQQAAAATPTTAGIEEMVDAWGRSEIKSLKNSVNYFRRMHNKRVAQENERNLEAIFGGRRQLLRKSAAATSVLEVSERENDAQHAATTYVAEVAQLLKDIETASAAPMVVDLSKRNRHHHVDDQFLSLCSNANALRERTDSLKAKIHDLVVANAKRVTALDAGAAASANALELTSMMAKALKVSKPELIGRVAIPSVTTLETPVHTHRIMLSAHQFNMLHAIFAK